MKPIQTQFFDAIKTNPKHPGRYLYLVAGSKKAIMRWWNGKNWQLNRRKALLIAAVPGDQWAGSPELHPEVEKLLSSGLSSSDRQPVKLSELMQASPKASHTALKTMARVSSL